MAPKNSSGLGRAIINRRTKQQRKEYEDELHQTSLPSGLHSVTQENDLDEFLNTAQLAGTEFTAERNNAVTMLPSTSKASSNPYLLNANEERAVKIRHKEYKQKLRVPRRPKWTREMDKEELETNERMSFLDWRRSLAELTDRENLLLTPFERNLAVWRQLWRTIERSQLVVQIVDARNPLGFRCEDLETYVSTIDDESTGEEDERPRGRRKNLLLVNKSDLLTTRQRQIWADYFQANRIAFAFFSALDATTLQEQLAKQDQAEAASSTLETEASCPLPRSSSEESKQDPTRVLTVEELEELFVSEAPPLEEFATATSPAPAKMTIGLVGYPNVGKSSTINALIGSKKVSVSSTPGKTKNFQTIHLPESSIILCDCPGLVFPQFATTKAELVCNGVLPIDQMREHTAPVDLVCQRIPKDVLEATYGLAIRTLPEEEGGTGVPTASELLSAYAVARGFFTQGQGNPDEPRAARPILKDYVSGKLLYSTPPPTGISADEFNIELRDLKRLAILDRVKTKKAPTTRVGKDSDTFIASPSSEPSENQTLRQEGMKSARLDSTFFGGSMLSALPTYKGAQAAGSGGRLQMFPHQRMMDANGNAIQGGPGGDRDPLAAASNSKKHHKMNKRVKQRSGKGYD